MLHILLADDDSDDREFIRAAFEQTGTPSDIIEARDGKDAMIKLDQLKHQGKLPALIVLDINMPKMDGRQTLLAIKADPDLSSIPVAIYSTSSNWPDESFFSERNTRTFTKPSTLDGLVQMARELLGFCSRKTAS